MPAIIVISAIILIFAFFLNMKIKAEISFINGHFDFKVKYLCFTIFPFKEKKIKDKKNKSIEDNKASKNNETDAQEQPMRSYDGISDNISSEVTEETKSEKKGKNKEPITEKIDKISSIIEKVKIIWSVSQKRLAHIFKHICIEDVMIDFLISDEDAYKAAMNYGAANAVVYNFINFIRTFFTVTIKTVDVTCDFKTKKSAYDFSVKITVRPATILSAVFGILFGLLINIKKLIGKNTKHLSEEKAVSM